MIGILNRLIGDRRKLYQARESKDYFFKELEPLISFEDKIDITTMASIRILNLKAEDPTLVTGGFISNSLFEATFSQRLFNILHYSPDELLIFLLTEEEAVVPDVDLNPASFADFVENDIKKSKKIESNESWEEAIELTVSNLAGLYSTEIKKEDFISEKGMVNIFAVYCVSLYVLQEKIKSEMVDNIDEFNKAFPKSGLIPGFARKGFTKKAFVTAFSSGKVKLIYGGPYKCSYWTQIEGKAKKTKVEELLKIEDGKLIINIDIDKKEARVLKKIIEEADVTVFPFGKKGIAHVSKVRT